MQGSEGGERHETSQRAAAAAAAALLHQALAPTSLAAAGLFPTCIKARRLAAPYTQPHRRTKPEASARTCSAAAGGQNSWRDATSSVLRAQACSARGQSAARLAWS